MTKSSRTRTRQKERQQERRRNRIIVIVVALVAAAIIFAVLAISSSRPAEAPIPAEVAQAYEGIERGFTDDGYPFLGSEDATVVVTEFSSFGCPTCREFHDTNFKSLLERVRNGEISFVYVPLSTGSIQNAAGASQGALCAGEQGMFWEMHDVYFDWQGRYVNAAFTQNRLLAGVDALGLDRDAWLECFNSESTANVLEAAVIKQVDEDVAGTPTIRVNGTTVGNPMVLDDINAAIDNALSFGSGGDAPETTPEPTEELPAVETEVPTEEPTEEPADEETDTDAEESDADTEEPIVEDDVEDSDANTEEPVDEEADADAEPDEEPTEGNEEATENVSEEDDSSESTAEPDESG